jgi:hypothetical protein
MWYGVYSLHGVEHFLAFDGRQVDLSERTLADELAEDVLPSNDGVERHFATHRI